MSSKYQVPVGTDHVKVKVTPAQFDAALNWSATTELVPDTPRHIIEVFPERDNWANGMRRCCTKLAEKGVLHKADGGYVLPPETRQHLEYYRYR